jgi:hypothetical protein
MLPISYFVNGAQQKPSSFNVPWHIFGLCRARYEDAKFFYEADTAKSLADFRPLLQGITFQVLSK